MSCEDRVAVIKDKTQGQAPFLRITPSSQERLHQGEVLATFVENKKEEVLSELCAIFNDTADVGFGC